VSVRIEFAPAGASVPARGGENLLDLATAAGVVVAAPCGGQGRCGRCRVRLLGAAPGLLGHRDLRCELRELRELATALRSGAWQLSLTYETCGWDGEVGAPARLVALAAGARARDPYGLAVDVGTTAVVAWLVHLASGRVVDAASAYNRQIACGEDVISRIIYAQRAGGLARLQELVIATINELVDDLQARHALPADQLREVVIAGNTTVAHLLLGVDPRFLRAEPYVPTFAAAPALRAQDLGLRCDRCAPVHLMPSVGSYVGGDISAGVVASGMYAAEGLSLLVDVGTNGELVLGTKDWLVACACSAGPAFEGAGVRHGARALPGAIEAVTLDRLSFEPALRTIEGRAPRGICGSGLIELLAELLLAGVIDRGGRLQRGLATRRIRGGEGGPEYVLVWAEEAADGTALTLSESDIANLVRAKAAVYAGIARLCGSVGVALAEVEEVFIAGAFGKQLDVAKAVIAGLLPDLPRERFRYLGNTSVLGAYAALISAAARRAVQAVAGKMTYLELAADNAFTDEYTSALFLPHTDLGAFPSVRALLSAVPAPAPRAPSP